MACRLVILHFLALCCGAEVGRYRICTTSLAHTYCCHQQGHKDSRVLLQFLHVQPVIAFANADPTSTSTP